MKKQTKQEEYLETATKICAYVNTETKIIGVYSTFEDSEIANQSVAVKKLTRLFGYRIQMVIK